MNRAPPWRSTAAPAARAAHAPAPPGRQALLPVAVIWLVLAFLILPPELNYVTNTFTVSQGGVSGPLILSSSLGCSVVIILWRWPQTLKLLPQLNRGFLAFVVLAMLSVLWSWDPGATSRRLFRLDAIVTSCLAFTLLGWQPRSFQRALRPLVTIILGGSLIFGLMAPDLAIEHGTTAELLGAWRGLTMQKNSLGSLSAVGVVLWFHAWLSREVSGPKALFNLAIAGTCLILSRSSTSLLSSLFAMPFLLLMLKTSPVMRRYMPYIIGIFTGLILAYSLAVLQLVPGLDLLLAPITAITGKDMTFSGRRIIWDIIVESIGRHPLLGVGFGAYWTGPVQTSASYDFVIRTYIYPTEAHNGYLDVINDLGYAGGACLITYLIGFVRQGLRLFKADRSQAALYLVLLFQGFMANLSESHWFTVSNFNFLIMTLATMCLGRHLLYVKAQSSAAGPAVTAAQPTLRQPAWRRS